MDGNFYHPSSLEIMARASSGLRQELLRDGPIRSNPAGGESYLERLGPERLAMVRADQFFPHRNGATPTDAKDAFAFTKRRQKWIEGGVDKNGRAYKGRFMPVNAGLIMSWGGPVPEKQTEYGPTMTISDGKGGTIKVSWAGLGWKMLKRLAGAEPPFTGTIRRGNRTIQGSWLPCQDLTPWSPSNPTGTGIWNVAAKRIMSGQVRKDEKYVAAGLMNLIGLILQELVLENETAGSVSSEKVRAAKTRIGDYLDAILISLFGTVDPFEIDKIDEEGKKMIEEFATEKAAERAVDAARKGGGSGLTGLAALSRR
jgi:hypothetical protein